MILNQIAILCALSFMMGVFFTLAFISFIKVIKKYIVIK